MRAFLRWWLMFWLIAFGVFISQQLNLIESLYRADVSKLSFVILLVFFTFTIYIGMLTKYKDQTGFVSNDKINICWFFADALPTIGMIGTVIGFLIMLGLAFTNLNVADVASIQEAIKMMALGMSTALVTTLVGMTTSLLLKIQLVNLENG